MTPAVFVDTWGWVALGHRRDPWHQAARGFYEELRGRGDTVCTSDYVLDETVTLLYRREVFEEATRFVGGILESAERGYLRIEYATPERFASAWELRKRYHDKPRISFTDFVTMVIKEELGMEDILTADEHFTQVGMGFQRVP